MPKDENAYIKLMQKLAGQADDVVAAGGGKAGEPRKGERLLVEIDQILQKKHHFMKLLQKHKHKKAEVERGVSRLEQAKEKLAQLLGGGPGGAPSTSNTPEAFIEQTKKLAMDGHNLVEKFGGQVGGSGGSIPDSEKSRVRSLLLQLEALANSKAHHEQVLDKDGAGHKKAELLRHVDRCRRCEIPWKG